MQIHILYTTTAVAIMTFGKLQRLNRFQCEPLLRQEAFTGITFLRCKGEVKV